MTDRPITAEQLFQFMHRPRRAAPTAAEEAFLGTGTRGTTAHRGETLATWIWPGAPRVLLVHGWDSHAGHLTGLAEGLRARGYGVAAFDAPAHGRSMGSRSNVMDIGRAVAAVVATHGPFDALVGHSVGSPAALHAFAHGAVCRASVHVSGPASLARVLAAQAMAAGLPADQLPALHRLVEAGIEGRIADMELDHLAHGFRHPALLLHAPEDAEIPFAESEALHRAWPGSRLVPLPGLGHRRIIGAAETIGLITSFLDEQLRRSVAA